MKKKSQMYRVWFGVLLIVIGLMFLYLSDQKISTWLGYGVCALGIFLVSLATNFVQQLVSKTALVIVLTVLGIFLIYAPDSRFFNWPEEVMWHGISTYIALVLIYLRIVFKKGISRFFGRIDDKLSDSRLARWSEQFTDNVGTKLQKSFLGRMVQRCNKWGKKLENETFEFFILLFMILFGLFLILGDLVFKIPKLEDAWIMGTIFTIVGTHAIISWTRTQIQKIKDILQFSRLRGFFSF